MKTLFAAAAAAAMLVAAPAFAGEVSTYGNLTFNTLNTGGLNLQSLGGRFGVRGQYLGAEAEGSFGISEEDYGGAQVKLSNQYGVYAVAFLPSGDDVDFFVRGGYGHAEVDVSAGGGSVTASDSMWSAGVGGQWFSQGGKNGVRFDVTHSWWDAGGDSDTISIAYVRKFGGK
ncbi:hypothetical protein QO010_000293 [Caulobacter ginsengisoli]|uniref:Outer membrane protein beta-barrel domain-containing protein n=1 Tax=Caulobacter ginsengisoli TaxID=400775 RepID=A0ABU0IKL2_9CAUL|nr:outer membrane beta-barrel protein [Caulobacter ginsengisoli]MDQ0462545.1 hypothetical protein [Caulobacter ginsengisoli]